MKKETESWLKIAYEDFQAAENLMKIDLYRMVCYHSQQTVEKILKALLTEKEIEFERSHNIIDLKVAVMKVEYGVKISDEDAVFLNSIYRSRYPSDAGLLPTGEPTKEDAEKALNIAQIILQQVGGLLQITKPED
ncbi:MAG: HEPN domain-containing protein [Candidatus Edwardsbacteria bacterium]